MIDTKQFKLETCLGQCRAIIKSLTQTGRIELDDRDTPTTLLLLIDDLLTTAEALTEELDELRTPADSAGVQL